MANGLTGQNFIEGDGQVMTARRRPLIENTELVIDSSLVADPPFGVENKRLWCALSAEVIGHAISFILQHRERNSVLLGVFGNALGGVLTVRVDSQELDALLRIGLVELGKA